MFLEIVTSEELRWRNAVSGFNSQMVNLLCSLDSALSIDVYEKVITN
jgi:hypothetical protein